MIGCLSRPAGGPVHGQLVILGSRRLSREALRRLLEAPSISVVGEGETLDEVLQGTLSDRSPDIVIHSLDTEADFVRGLSDVAEARTRLGAAKQVMLADRLPAEVLVATLRAGVDAILSRDISADVLLRSLELILLGQRIFLTNMAQVLRDQPAIAAEASDAPVRPERQPPTDRRQVGELSRREQQILQCLVDGLPNKIIARELDITEATVKVHIKALLRKTNLANRTQAAIWALGKWPAPGSTASAG